MDGIEDKNGNEEENARINKEACSQNTETKLEGNEQSSDSNQNTEIVGAILENKPQSAANVSLKGTNKVSSDDTEDNFNENLEKVNSMGSPVTKNMECSKNPDMGKGSGDYAAKTKVSDEVGKKNDDISNIGLNEATTSKSDSIGKPDENIDTAFEKDNNIKFKLADDDDNEDDDMELRWDDDDDGEDNEKAESGKVDLSEEQIFEKKDVNAKGAEINPERKTITEESEVKDKNVASGNILLKEPCSEVSDITLEKEICLKKSKNNELETNINAKSSEKSSESNRDKIVNEIDDSLLENKLLEGADLIPESPEVSSELESPTKKNVDKAIDDLLEDKLLEETNINTEAKATEIDILIQKSPDENLDNLLDDNLSQDSKKMEFCQSFSDKDITEKEVEEIEELLKEDKLLTELDNKDAKEDTVEAKDLEECDTVLEEELLKESDRKVESFAIPETDVTDRKSLDKNDDVLMLNDDVLMKEIDDELNDDECRDDSCNAMDADSSDKSIDQTTIENKNVEQPIVELNPVEQKIIDSPTGDHAEVEDKNIQQTVNDLAEKKLNQSIEEKAMPMYEQTELEKKDGNKPIDNQVQVIEKNKEKLIDQAESADQAKIDGQNVDPPIDDANKTEQTSNTPLEKDTHSNIPNVDKEDLNKTPTEKAMLETEVENKSIIKLEKTSTKEVKETMNIDTGIKKNSETENMSINISIGLDNSPVRINTDHGLNKPDVMLEIPTQELIDMDDTDLSINLDQTEGIDSPIDEEKGVSDYDIVNETAVGQKATVTELIVGKFKTEDINIVEQSIEKDKKGGNLVVQDTIEESFEKWFAEDEPAEDAGKEVAECIAATNQVRQETEAQPSTSYAMLPDTSDEVPEVSDSLGLLAESSGRMMEDDEEPEDDDDADDDDDFDQDESSNQISAEQSEDSNPAASEAEQTGEKEIEIETPDTKDVPFDFMIEESASREEEKMDIEEVQIGTVELQAQTINDEETKSAVDALLKDVDGDSKKEIKEIQDSTDIETVKLSDTSDNEIEIDTTQIGGAAVLEDSKKETADQQEKAKSPPKQSQSKQLTTQLPAKQSPSKMKKLEIKTMEASDVVNIVYLEESSSEDDIQEIQKQPEPDVSEDKPTSPDPDTVTKVNIPSGIDIMCTSGGTTSEMVTKEGEVVISGIPKPPPHKPARLNTSEVSIKTASTAEPLVIPETKINEKSQPDTQTKPKLSLEIFSLDSDDEDSAAKEKPETTSPHKMTALELEEARETSKCINYCCTSGNKVPYKKADASIVAYYDAGRKRRSMVCQPCADVVANRTKNLIEGIKNLTPLLDLEMGKMSQDLVEISDSESEDEETTPDEPKESIGEKGAKFLEENLEELLNETWKNYNLDARLKEAQIMLEDEMEKLEKDSKEIDAMLNECQVATDKLRCDLYATFEYRRQELPGIILYDTPDYKYIGPAVESITPTPDSVETRQAKRRLSSSSEIPAKRPAIPLGYAPLDADKESKTTSLGTETKLIADDDKDISVVKLSAESAPADLPPPGEISRPPLRVSMPVYAMKNAFGPWLKGRIIEIQPKNAVNQFSLCRVKFDHKTKTNGKVLPARCVAYAEPADVRMTIGTRLIALFKDSNKRESYYSGVVAEIPNPVNNYRYLVFFDDGYAQYVQHAFTRLVCESSPLVWEEVHPFSREFVKEYLLAYPERPMVRLHEGQHLKTEWNGKWWSSRVIRVDASLAQVMFVGDGRREWIYRGSTRLAPLYLELRAAERHRPRPMPRSKAQPRSNMPYVEYTRSDEPESTKQPDVKILEQQQNEEIRRQRSVAKKSTSVPPLPPPPQQQVPGNLDTVTSRVVYYTPKNAVKPYKMTPHRCGPKCKRSDVLSLKELRTYNPLAKPLLSGWERQIVRFKGHKDVMYRAPCGRRLRCMRELHKYLRTIDSDLPVDLFDFHHSTHCLAEFVLNKCLVGKKDLSHGKENVPVPCVNYYDESLPEFCSYNTERTPTAGVPLNLDPEFLCGCDCTDDCQDKSKCACWKMTLEGARTIGLSVPGVGYVYRRLPEPLPSGIYECNSRCKCKHTCLNRVAQQPLQLKLQVFKTLNRGWGIRALNDVPKGSFLCVYAGNLLTDATANLDGLNEGDEYLAELDYIEVVEQMKEGFEEDIPEADKRLDKKKDAKGDEEDEEDEEPTSSEEDDTASKTDKEDDDFRPGYIGLGVQEFSKRLRKRERSKKDKAVAKEKDKETKDANAEEDCITISDDEEVREPSRFNVQAGMGANEFISKYKSVRTLFGKDEACYIMDAKVQGNIGRYLNHSCTPNVFVQNVFVDTHDPRFPWVAFFALSHIKAGTELTWNYNYDVGSVPGKVLYCYCGAPNCRGRLL